MKYAAELAGKPYVCVPTAASMDGYAASGAALREGGFKRTLACAAPVAVVADLDVIAAAPAVMGAWGYGDLVGKLVAGVDWIVADALGEEALDPGPFAMVQDNLAGLAAPSRRRARSRPHRARRPDARPADGGPRHAGARQLAAGQRQRPPVRPSLGDGGARARRPAGVARRLRRRRLRVDGGGLRMAAAPGPDARSTRRALAVAGAVDGGAEGRDRRRPFRSPFMAANAATETLAKASPALRIQRRLSALKDELARASGGRCTSGLPQASTVRQWLDTVGGPSTAAALGIARDKHARDHARARLIRRRFTGLDVLHDLGWLDRAVCELFAPGGFWFNDGRKKT